MSKNIFLAISWVGMIICLASCGWVKNIGYKSADRVGNSVDKFHQELFPADSLSKKLMLGLIEGATNEQSVQKLEYFSQRIVDTLMNKLEIHLESLNLKSVGTSVIAGLREELGSDSMKLDLEKFRMNLENEIQLFIRGVLAELTSQNTNAELKSLIANIMSDANRKQIQSFLSGILSGIELDSLGEELRSGILNETTKEAFSKTIMAPILETLERMEKIVDKVNDQTQDWWDKYFWQLIAGVIILAGILSWFYIQRRKVRHNQMALEEENRNLKSRFQFNEQLNNIILSELDQLKQQTTPEELKLRIKQKAIEHGIEADVHQKLSQLRMLQTMNWSESK